MSSTSARATRKPVYRAPRRIGGNGAQESTYSRRSGGSKRLRRRRDLVGYLFSGPALVILGIFVFYPTIYALYMSFTDASGFNEPTFIGIDNYKTALTNPDSLNAIWNTLVYAIAYAPLVIIVALALALLLNRTDLFLRSVLRTTIFLPFIISMAVAALAYSFILDARTGILPYWASRLGIQLPGHPQQQHLGTAGRHLRCGVEELRLFHGHLHRRLADDSAGSVRGCRDRRRERVAQVRRGDPAGTSTHDGVRRHPGGERRVPGF